MIFPKSYLNIITSIYENPGIRLNELIRKSRIAVNTAKDRLNNLLISNIIIEKKVVGGKRILLKNFYPNLNSEEGKCVFSILELEKKNLFFIKNPKLMIPFNQLIRWVNDKIDIILVFGSFANFSQTKDSDLDLLLLTNKKIDKEQIRKIIERSFITFDHEISPRIDSIKNFKENKEIYDTIKRNHVVVFRPLKFIEILEKKKDYQNLDN